MTRRATALSAALLLACAASSPPAWELPPPPAPDAPIVQPGSLTRTALPNGLQVLVLRDRRLPRVSVGIALRRGEGSVESGRAGLAPFTAELLKRGAGERDALALASAVDALGSSLAAGSGWDSTTVALSGLSRDAETLLDLLADVALRPRFDPAEAEKARAEQLGRLERAKDDPSTLAYWSAAELLYPGHRYGLPLRGNAESLAGLDAAAARAFHARIFVPNNAVFFAAGDVEPEALVAGVRARFSDWERGPVPEPAPPPPKPTPSAREIRIVDRPDLVQAKIVIAHEGLARTDPERIAAALLNSVVGGSGFSSRLHALVRSEGGLTYGVYSGFSLRRRPGPFSVSTSTRVAEARRVVDLLLAELARARDEPPDESELTDARSLAVGRFALGLETSGAVLEALVDLEIHGLPPDSLDTYRGRVQSVGPDQTAELARRLLHPGRAAIVLVGPADALRGQLEGLGPIAVRSP